MGVSRAISIETIWKFDMGGHDRCCAAGCNNDKRNENSIKQNHEENLVFHAFLKNEKKRCVDSPAGERFGKF